MTCASYERFVDAQPAHASPLEHVATPADSRRPIGREPARLDPVTPPRLELTLRVSRGLARSERFTRLYLSAVALVTTKPLMSCAGAEANAVTPCGFNAAASSVALVAGSVVAGFFGSMNVSSEPGVVGHERDLVALQRREVDLAAADAAASS